MSLARPEKSISVITFVLLVLTALGFDLAVFSGQVRNDPHQRSTIDGREAFELISIGDTVAPECKADPLVTGLLGSNINLECVPLVVRVYQATDGFRANLTHGRFSSPNLARARLRAWMKPAKKTIRDETKSDSAGTVIGERVVGSFRDKNSTQEYFQIAWVDGLDCYLISASSLSTALHLEEWTNAFLDGNSHVTSETHR